MNAAQHSRRVDCGLWIVVYSVPKLVIPPGPNEQGGVTKQRLRGDSGAKAAGAPSKTGEVEGDQSMITGSYISI